MKITIDKYSGFCFGVVYAIQMAEELINETTYTQGNENELERNRSK